MQNGSIAELAADVNAWCAAHQIEPLHNGVGAEVTVRNIRYYQTLGLVDRPAGPFGKGFGEKHRLQLIAIRLLQARGLPLQQIRDQLEGRTEEELRQIEQRGATEQIPVATRASTDWKVMTLSPDFLLLSRQRNEISPGQRQRILEILNTTQPVAPRAITFPTDEPFRPEID
jgi:DNA-binding transcriptional MerR regulator